MSEPIRVEAGVLSVRRIERSFGTRVALHPLDLDIGPGGVTGLLGPNGSGKSTLLRCSIGLVRPDGGSVAADGVVLSREGTALRRRVAYMPGELRVYGELTGTEHLAFLLRGRSRDARKRARELAGELSLPLRVRVRGYSHGMKRQLFLAAALAPDVPVRLLDEPTDGLDPAVRGRALELVRRDAERGTTILLCSHHLAEVEAVCDRILFLSQGRLLADQTRAEVRHRMRRRVVFEWADAADAERAETRLRALGAEEVRPDGARTTVSLGGEDPLEFLGRLAADRDAPRPKSVEFGRMSLGGLYRDVYGVEGL